LLKLLCILTHSSFIYATNEECALDSLHRLSYECYLPTILGEKLCEGLLIVAEKQLFLRSLFIRLCLGDSTKNWVPFCSTKGVRRLVSFGEEPARVGNDLFELLRTQEVAVQIEPEQLFNQGERISLTEVPFAGIEGIYQMPYGERRVMVLIELLSKQVRVRVAPANLRKVG